MQSLNEELHERMATACRTERLLAEHDGLLARMKHLKESIRRERAALRRYSMVVARLKTQSQ